MVFSKIRAWRIEEILRLTATFYVNTLKMKVASLPALDTRTSSSGGSDRSVVFLKDNFVFQIYNGEDYFSYDSKTNQQEALTPATVDSIFERILSSFKFT